MNLDRVLSKYKIPYERVRRTPGKVIKSEELYRRVGQHLGISKDLSKEVIDAIGEVYLDALLHREGVKLPGLGRLNILDEPDKRWNPKMRIFVEPPRRFKLKHTFSVSLEEVILAKGIDDKIQED